MNSSSCLEDYQIGPITTIQCRDGLDFTLLFEESFFSLLPAALMTLASVARVVSMRNNRKLLLGNSFNDTKLIHLILIVLLRFILLLLWSLQAPIKTKTSIASATFSLIESFAFLAISRSEHFRSLRPSSLLNLYLLLSLGFDIIRMRTLVKMEFDSLIVSLFAANIAVKTSLLILEAQSKRIYFSATDADRPPNETSGIFNRSVFWWLNALFLKGYRSVLTLKDLYPLDEELSSKQTLRDFEMDWNSRSSQKSYRLATSTIISLRRLFLIPVVPNIIVMGLTFAQPYLVSILLSYISSSQSKETGYLIVVGYAVVYPALAIFTAFQSHQVDRFVTMVRACLVTIIYQKTLTLDLKEASRGESLTLMSADVERVALGFKTLHQCAANIAMSILALGLLYLQIGLSLFAPLVFSMVLALLSGKLSFPLIYRQRISLEAAERRVAFTSSVISAMKGVKILGLVDYVHSKIDRLRRDEIHAVKKLRVWYAAHTLLQTISLDGTRWITYTAFGIISIVQGTESGFDVNSLFTSLAILNIFMNCLEIVLRQIPAIASSFGCLRRIEIFLLSDSKRDNRLQVNVRTEDFPACDGYELKSMTGKSNMAISTKELSIGWTDQNVVLMDVTLNIPKFTFTIMTGPVGSGKSTLLQALLGEVTTQKGFLNVSSVESMAYCAQTPWLINKSIQENILGVSVFDEPWYKEVLSSCALFEDLKYLPAGDKTLVGSRGVTLSGGQKQRIALARAVYSKKHIVLLDDIFSGLDPVTEEMIFSRLLGRDGILRRGSTTVILATHAVHFLSAADLVVILGSDGNVAYQGSYGGIPTSLISKQNLKNSSHASESQVDALVPPSLSDTEESSVSLIQELPGPEDSAPDWSRQTGNAGVYRYYFKMMGWRQTFLFMLLGMICMAFAPAQNFWLNAWANDTGKGKIGYYIGIYSLLLGLELILTSIWIWHVLMFPLPASSIKLHNAQLGALMSTTDTGVTTNRFSQDMNLIDNELSLILVDTVEYTFNCTYKLIVIGVGTVWVIAVFPFILAAFWLVQRFYLRTSRQIRFLDLETKSPLYTHFIESMAGLATLRGFSWEKEFESQNYELLQASQKPFFILTTIQRWLSMVLDLIVSGLAVIVAILAVELRESINPGFLGLALVNVMTLGAALKSLVSFWTGLETSIGAVSRIRSFTQDTPSEDPMKLAKAPVGWLHSGRIEMKHVYASHTANSDPSLHDINLTITPGEHIGICGRSGSGKSSLLSVIFRLMNVTSGSVLIDDTDISKISINQVRGSINALSQEAFFLLGTIRDNLVTANAISQPSEVLQDVLTRVGLWTKVLELGGLDAVLDAEEMLSHGERQLFCLARALLNPSRVLVLDEFTSNVDITTDIKMQRIIQEDFKDRTILAVAHRLDTILDFDRIVVLDRGRVVEDGPPSELLSNKDSAFWGLYSTYRQERAGRK